MRYKSKDHERPAHRPIEQVADEIARLQFRRFLDGKISCRLVTSSPTKFRGGLRSLPLHRNAGFQHGSGESSDRSGCAGSRRSVRIERPRSCNNSRPIARNLSGCSSSRYVQQTDMRSRRVILFFCRGVLACVAIVADLSGDSEPSWEGRKLSSWLMEGYGAIGTHTGFDNEAADAAVRHVGTNALPYLVRELGAKHSSTKLVLASFASKQSVLHVHYVDGDSRRHQAVEAFRALGQIPAPALPQLRRYLSDPELRSDAQKTIDAILERSNPDQSQEPSADTASLR